VSSTKRKFSLQKDSPTATPCNVRNESSDTRAFRINSSVNSRKGQRIRHRIRRLTTVDMLQKGSSGAKHATPTRDMPRGQKKDSKPLRTNAHGVPHDLLSLTARPSFVASFQGQREMGANTENSFGESRSEPPYTNIDAFCFKPLQRPKSRFENPTPSNSVECVRHGSRTVVAMTGVSPIGHKTKKPGRANTPRN